MLMFISLTAIVAAVSALPYSGYSGYSGYSKVLPTATTFTSGVVPAAYSTGYSSNLLGGYTGLSRGYTTGFAGGHATGYTYGQTAVAPLAVQSSHQIQYADVPSGGNINPVSVDVDANPVPINMVFRSASSLLNVQQAHQGAAGSVQESASEDEPHYLKHSVTKPVIQEVREVITPFRRITQEVQPVQEQISTVVARGVNKAVLAAPVAYNTHAVSGFAAPYATTGYSTSYAAPLSQTAYSTGFSSFSSPSVFTNKNYNY